MGRSTTPTFALTLPLRYHSDQITYLDKLFRVCGYMCNNLISEHKSILAQMEETQEWKDINQELSDVRESFFALAGRMEKSTAVLTEKRAELEKLAEDSSVDTTQLQSEITELAKEAEKLTAEYNEMDQKRKKLYRKKTALEKSWGFSKNEFQKKMKKYRSHYEGLVNSAIAQRLSDQVWEKFDDYLHGKGEQITFIPWQNFRSIEAKTNTTGLIYRNGLLTVNKTTLRVVLPDEKDIGRSPSAWYENECLKHRIKYCRLIRKPGKNRWIYMVQIMLEGEPPLKRDPKTNDLLHPIGTGTGGLDIGPQTLATVTDTQVRLEVLAHGAQNLQNEIRRVNRALDRSRRALNKDFFNEDGTIIPIDKLPGELVRKGKRLWKISRRYERLSQKRRYLYAKQAALRLQRHRELANILISLACVFYIEDMNWQALAKRMKETKINPKTGRPYSKKRYGKSIANRAPGLFVTVLAKALAKQGGELIKINTRKAKASQYNHEDKAYYKKHLSTRWNYMSNGRRVQRDLYSGFLMQHTNATLDGFDQKGLEQDFENFLILHDRAVEDLKDTLLAEKLPSSMGIR